MLSAIEIMEDRALASVEQLEKKVASARKHLVWAMGFNQGTDVRYGGNARHTASAFISLAEALDMLADAKEALVEIQKLIAKETKFQAVS